MAQRLKTILIVTACYDEPRRTMGSVPKIARQLSKFAKVVVFSGGAKTRVEERNKNLKIYFFKEWLVPDPVNNGFIPRITKKLDFVLTKEKPDAVLNVKHMFQTSLLVPYLKRKGYRVVTATDTWPGFTWFTTSAIANVILWLYARTLPIWVLKRSDKVILYHHALVPIARKLKLNYVVIPNGVELVALDAAKPKALAGRRNIIYVGRLESVKGYETICDAMKQVTDSYPDVHFYHVGDKLGKDSFVHRYEGKRMHFVGRKSINEVYSYMKGADIILLASKSEGLPNTIMEGMAAGCVPVSTPVGAVPDLLDGGRLGRLFHYGDVAGLVKQVNWLLSNPAQRARMSREGSKKIRKEYDWNSLSKRYLDVLFPTEDKSRRRVH